MRQSLLAGEPVRRDVRNIADSLAPRFTLLYSFELWGRALDEVVTVEDGEMVDAMRLPSMTLSWFVELAGAAATTVARAA